jgi:hypothetical protein
LIRLDLPTFDRPAKAIWGRSSIGKSFLFAPLIVKRAWAIFNTTVGLPDDAFGLNAGAYPALPTGDGERSARYAVETPKERSSK